MEQSITTTPVDDSVSRVNDEIAVGEDLPFQRSWWRFERAVWVVFVALMVLDLAGAFGRGPLANASMRSADGALELQYERIERNGTPAIMTVRLGPSALQGGVTRLFIGGKLVNGLGVQRIIPQPAATEVGRGGLTYTFPVSVPPAAISIELQPQGPGAYPLEIAIPGGPSLHTRIYVMP